jgi:hypothetical protein
MPVADTTRVKLRTGGAELEYEGSESFLRSDLPKIIDVIAGLRIPSLGRASTALNETIKEIFLTMATLGDVTGSTKADISSMSELSELECMRLQMAMDRMSKMAETLSNILTKMSDTSEEIIKNIK